MIFSKNPFALRVTIISGFLILWVLVYSVLKRFSEYLTYTVFHFSHGTHLGDALAFFLYDTPKVIMLLTLIVFGIGILRTFFTPEKTRAILAGKKSIVGNIFAAFLGVVTPFCSCSAVPLFIGFVQAGVPLGVTFSFLVSAPMVNEIALVLLFGLFGWKIAALYMGTGLAIALVAGIVIGKLRMEKHVEGWVYDMRMGDATVASQKLTWADRIDQGWQAVKDIVIKVWPYIVAGILVGAAIHGYVPAGLMAKIMGAHAWWSVPLAVAIGIPMYSNAAGIIPIVEALLAKGAALGTVLAFMMSVIGLSLPEMVILRKVLKPTLIATFIAVVGTGILLVGFLFNFVLSLNIL
jgi:uncharacterized membrane protein YraQ (UPF0718 family)